ncbi:MAG: hypothetical protein EWM73_03090 [Nitrospira sp.]|nr:MAG: hypothetical protein EWM73_03090 [Nitrospira sp.]
MAAFYILCSTHEAASSFLDIFEQSRQQRNAKGTPADIEQDLLRAMLAFAASGLDSMVKQLIRNTLAKVIECRKGAMGNFKQFIEKRLSKKEVIDAKLLAEVLASRDPRDVLVSELINELVSQSLQSKDALLRAASYFDIPSVELTSDIGGLGRIFDARNQIVHEMDVDFTQRNRSRRPRRKDDMIQHTTELLRIGGVMLHKIDNMLTPQS